MILRKLLVGGLLAACLLAGPAIEEGRAGQPAVAIEEVEPVVIGPLATKASVDLVVRKPESTEYRNLKLTLVMKGPDGKTPVGAVASLAPKTPLVLDVGQTAKTVTLKLAGLVLGRYTIEVTLTGDGATGDGADSPISIKEVFEVVRRKIAFEPTLTGGLVTNNTVIFTPGSADDRTFHFALKNPDTGRVRCIRIPSASTGDGDALDITFAFEGVSASESTPNSNGSCKEAGEGKNVALFGLGQERSVRATITGTLKPDPKTYTASIVVEDPALSGLAVRAFALNVEPAFGTLRPTWAMAYAFFAVLVGAVISVLLNHAGPRLLDKSQGRRDLIGALGVTRQIRDARIRLRLENENYGLLLRLNELSLFSQDEEYEEAKTGIDGLVKKVATARDIARLHEDLYAKLQLPLVLVQRELQRLRDAAWDLVNGRLDEAKIKLDAAESIELTKDNVNWAQTELARDIEKLKVLAAKDLPERFKEDWNLLSQKQPLLKDNKVPQGDIVDLNIRLFRLNLLLRDFDQVIARSKSLKHTLCGDAAGDQKACLDDLRQNLIALLERSGQDALEAASKMVRDMQTGFLPDQIVGHLSDRGRIEMQPETPQVGEIVVFTLSLGEPYDSSTAARELRYRWTIQGANRPLSSTGKRCSIVFDEDKEDYSVDVQALKPDGSWVRLEPPKSFQVRKAKGATSWIPGHLEFFVFLASVFIAAILAWTLHFGAFEITKFSHLLVPFLIGIGIDQFRNKLEKKGDKGTVDALLKKYEL